MKWHLLFFILAIFCFDLSKSQDKFVNSIEQEERDAIQKYLKERYWSKSQDRYDVAIPDNLANSGSVYLFKESLQEYFRNSKNFLRNIHVEHNIIKILSKNGLENHQVFAFDEVRSAQSVSYTALKIVKSDGKQIIINIDSIAVLKRDGKVQHKQFIIPNLEVGDIIDYYTYLEFRVLFPEQYSRAFDPVYVLPQSNIPIVDYNLVFTLGPSAFINVSESNIPPLKKTVFKIDKRTFTRYSLKLKNLPLLPKNTSYFYPFQSLANLKFQVFVGPYIGDTDIKYNLGGSLKMNNTAQLSRLQDYIASVLETKGDKLLLKRFKKEVKSENLDFKFNDVAKTTKLLYGFYQNYSRVEYIQSRKHKATDDFQFVREFSFLLKRLKIEHEIVIAFDRQLSNIDKFVLTNELNLLIKVPTLDDNLYLFTPRNLNNVNDIPYNFQGTQAYIFNPKNRRLRREVIPTNIAQQNKEISTINLKVLNDELATVNRSFKTVGQCKKHLQNIIQFDVNDKNELFKFVVSQNLYKKKQLSNWFNAYQEIIKRQKEDIKSYLLKELSADFESLESDTYRFKLVSAGVQHENDSLIFEDEFQLSNFAKRANNNLIIPIGKFIPVLNEVKEDRAFDFYFDFPFTNSIKIYFDIPKQYEIDKSSRFNKDVENRVGALSSSCNIKENQLVMEINYSLKSYFEPNKYKGEVLELLNAISALNNLNIVLKFKE